MYCRCGWNVHVRVLVEMSELSAAFLSATSSLSLCACVSCRRGVMVDIRVNGVCRAGLALMMVFRLDALRVARTVCGMGEALGRVTGWDRRRC